jgi:phosphoglycolate phosphatase
MRQCGALPTVEVQAICYCVAEALSRDTAVTYRLAIFDFDGTLADSADWIFGIFNAVAARHRFRQVSADEIEMLRGLGTRQILSYLGVPAWRLPFIARDMRQRSAAASGEIKLFAGIPDLLEQLAASGITIGVVSSNGEATVRAVLGERLAGLVQHYDCGAGLFGKAAKLKKLVRRAGMEAGEVACIGDETRDVEAARQAGLAALAVTWGLARAEALDACAPDALFDTVEELRARLLGTGP